MVEGFLPSTLSRSLFALLRGISSSAQPGRSECADPPRDFAHWGISVQRDANGQKRPGNCPPHHNTRTLKPPTRLEGSGSTPLRWGPGTLSLSLRFGPIQSILSIPWLPTLRHRVSFLPRNMRGVRSPQAASGPPDVYLRSLSLSLCFALLWGMGGRHFHRMGWARL